MFCLDDRHGRAPCRIPLTRFYTTPTRGGGRAAFGGLVAVLHRLLYLSARAGGANKFEVMHNLVGSSLITCAN